MKHNKSLLVCCLLLILSSTATNAQFSAQSPYPGYANHSLTLRSDFPSKSVLISTLIADRAGDMSPVIGAASWPDSGKQLQCRSLLQFNYQFLPTMLLNDPSMITSAELVLYPLHVNFSDNDLDKPSKLIVKRVLEDWVDSTTMWINQPLVDSSMEVIRMIKKKQKEKPVFVDVTNLVLKMLRYGNSGFMISNEISPEQSLALGQLFASPKNDNEDIRPVLIINYRTWDYDMSQFNLYRDEMRMREIQNSMPRYPSNSPVTQPVIQPSTTPATQPASSPIKS